MRVAVVLAGGLGTRVAHLTSDDRPKALLPIAGRAFIDVKLAQLAASGAEHAVVLTGHGGDLLRAHLASADLPGLQISVHDDGAELRGTGGAVLAVREHLPEIFWITYGDTLVEAPLADIERALDDDCVGVMTVLHNRDKWAPSNASVEQGRVVQYAKGLPPGSVEWIDFGLLLLRRSAFDAFADRPGFDLTEVLSTAVGEGRLGAYPVGERFHEIGTEVAWRETDAWARRSHLLDRLGIARPV
jgi:NDP-sugar pyrophosphorylase family protein